MMYRIYMDKDSHKMAIPIKNREELMVLRNSVQNLKHLVKVRKGNEQLRDKEKRQLLQIAYNLGHVNGALAGCQSIGSFFFHDIDSYGLETSEQIKQQILSKKEEIGLMMLERSASYGWHLVCKRIPGTTILENQVRVATILRIEMDTNAKDLQRVVFSTSGSEDDLPYLNDELFSEPMTPEECEAEYANLKERENRGMENVPKGAKESKKHYKPWEEAEGNFTAEMDAPLQRCSSNTEPPQAYDPQARYNGKLYSDIIAKYLEMYNSGNTPCEGDRNVLTFELAVTIRSICGYSIENLSKVIPNYWKDPETGNCSADDEAEYRRTLESALKEPKKGMSYRLKQVLNALKTETGMKVLGCTKNTPPPMPEKLPPLIGLLTKNVPTLYKPAVASAVFPALGVHIHGVKFRYLDNVDHESTFMNVLIGRQSIGKGSIKKPIEYIMDDIRKRDLPNRQREAEWKQRNPGAKQKKDPRPTDICIQMLVDNLTDAVFNQRIIDAHTNGERFIYTQVDEIEGLKRLTSRNSAAEVGLLIRKAFDNSTAGQERVGADSVSGIAPLRWNFNASTTPPNAQRFFYNMVNDGTVSRLDIATIISNDDNNQIPVMGIYDDEFAQKLKPYIDRLEAANGLIECPQANKLAQEMVEENNATADLLESEAYRLLGYRAIVIAWLKGMVLYVSHGYKWSQNIADFVRYSLKYNQWCKMLYFGEQLEKELDEEKRIQNHAGPQNLLTLLPNEFTLEDYKLTRQRQGKNGDGKKTLYTWVTRGYIVFDDVSGRYCKTEKFLRRGERP